MTDCVLCHRAGALLWQDDFCHVMLVDDTDYPGYCRVILNRHVREMSDLDESERQRLMTAVFATESAVFKVMSPDKINLASLGNMAPHVHWHIIPRFIDDKHFPNSIWGPAKRKGKRRKVDQQQLKTHLNSVLGQSSH